MPISKPTKTSIINAALATLGQEPIVSLDDETSAQSSVKMMLSKFDIAYREFLASHDWNCARKYVRLNQLSECNNKGWKYCFALPTTPEIMRISQISVNEGDLYYDTNAYYNSYSGGQATYYDIAGGYLYSNYAPIYISYIGLIDPAELDPLVAAAFSYMLASELAYAIPASVTLADYLYQIYRKKLRAAKSADALSRNTPKYDGDVIRARRGFGGPEVVVDHSDEV